MDNLTHSLVGAVLGRTGLSRKSGLGMPALVLGMLVRSVLPMHFVAMAWFIVPAAALIAAAIMRFMRHRQP